MKPWLFCLAGLERWLTIQLLRSPGFHQMVSRVHQRVQHIRHGIPLEPSRTTLDHNGVEVNKFVAYFKEEIKDQMKGKVRDKI